jgi:flagellar hook-basal body complex protein FliE
VISAIPPIGEGAGAVIPQLAPMPAPMAPLPAPGVEAAGATPGTGGFATLLTRATSGLADQIHTADRLQELAASGQLPDPTVAIIETQKANLSLDLAVQVRNRLVEGWQELSRMSV